jgi:hypothetical protein
MKTGIDVLAGLIAVKELEIKTLKERVAQLQHQVNLLTAEANQLYAIISEREKHTQIGFKKQC